MFMVATRALSSSAAATGAALLSWLKPVGMGYALTVAIALAAQRKLQYFPTPEYPEHPARLDAGFSGIEEHAIVAEDGTTCFLWHW